MNVFSKKLFAATLLASVSAAVLASTFVPKGTPVNLVFDDAVSSDHARAGDKVALHVAEDVIVKGDTVLKAGTKVTGVVSNVRKRGHFGVNAKLAFTLNPVRGLTLEPATKGKDFNSRTDHAGEAAGAGALILGPIGLAGGYFVVGKHVEIHPGDDFYTEVSRGTRVR